MQTEAPLRFLDHLIELRRRLIICASVISLFFIIFFYYSDQLYHGIALPLLASLPQGQSVIATHVAAPLIVPLELAFVMAILIAAPVLLYQLWAFIAPGLYQHEQRKLWPLLLASVLLFYLGIAFAYFFVFPMMFGFFAKVLPKGVVLMPDMSQYLDFVFKIFLAFGFSFQVPVITLLLVMVGVLSRAQLAQARPYVIIGAFVAGMLLTPPDVVSQVMLAIPIWLLFELGLLVSSWVEISAKQSQECSSPE